MSPVRYRREGLRVVRVEGAADSPAPCLGEALSEGSNREPPGHPTRCSAVELAGKGHPVPVQAPGREPGPAAPSSLADADDDYRLRLHRFAQDVRAAVRRYRGLAPEVTGADLRRARRLAGVSQWTLAARLRVSRGTIADAETGRRPVHGAAGAWARGVLLERGGGQP